MKPDDINLFKKYLSKSKKYFEFGSGGSTILASQSNNINEVFSVESSKEYLNILLNDKKLVKDKVKFILVDLNSKKNNWGYPAINDNTIMAKYSDAILNIKNIDYILIDGRFRVACALKAFDVMSKDTIIAFDDFLNREKYHIILQWFDIIDKRDYGNMVILRKKSDVKSPPLDIIKKYELISE